MKTSQEFVKGKNNIGYVSSSFLTEFGNDEVVIGSPLICQKLTRSMTDSEIISELGVQECTLGDVLATLDNSTEEMKDGNWNIFYIKGHARVVRVYWGADGGEWRVLDWYRGGGSWSGGSRVFSPAIDSRFTSTLDSGSLTLEDAIKIVKKAGYQVIKII